jgi:hypothetical protein
MQRIGRGGVRGFFRLGVDADHVERCSKSAPHPVNVRGNGVPPSVKSIVSRRAGQDPAKPVHTGPGDEIYKRGARATHSAKKILKALTGGLSEEAEGIVVGSAIRFEDISIDGVLDLSALSITKPIIFSNCNFYDPIIARNARFDLLIFDDCEAPTINLYQLRTTNSLLLTRCDFRDGIDLAEIEVEGLLDLGASRIAGPLRETSRTGLFDGDRYAALNGYNIKVIRGLSLSNLCATGVVNLRNSEVGELDLDGAEISCTEDNVCVDARNLTSHGDVTLGRGFKCKGVVNMVSATIAGRLDFRGGVFDCVGEEEVISCDGIIVGHVFFHADISNNQPPAEVNGRIVLSNARINGRLDMRGAQITMTPNQKKAALDCDYALIDGNVMLSDKFFANGRIRFHQAKISGQFNMDGACVNSPGEESAIVLNSARVEKNVYFRNGFSCVGGIDGIGAELGGVIVFSGCNIDACAYKYAIKFGKSRITRSVEFTNEAKINGAVSFRGARIGLSFKFKEVNIARCAPWLDLCEAWAGEEVIERDVVIDLVAASAGTSIEFEKIRSFDGWIDLRRAKTRIYVDDASCWASSTDDSVKAHFLLDGFTYEYFPQFMNAGMKNYERWLKLKVDADSERDLSVQPWTHLSRILRNSGHERTARKVAVAREKVRQRYARRKLELSRWFFGAMFGLLVGYGYRPNRGVVFAVVTVLLGGFVYWQAANDNMIVPSQPAIIVNLGSKDFPSLPDAYGQFNPLIFSLDVFVPFLDLHQETRWLPREQCHPSQKLTPGRSWGQWFINRFKRNCSWLNVSSYKIFMVIQTIVGWIIIALTGLAFSGVFKRE